MEDFYYEESNAKHVFLKCLLFLFLVGVAFGIFLFYKKENTIKLKDIKVEINSSLSKNIADYIEDDKFSEDCKLYLDKVDITKVGTYNYKIKYNKHVETAKIIVVDTKKPIVSTNEIVIGVNEKLDPSILVTSCVDDSLPCSINLKRQRDIEKLKKPGTYQIELEVSDSVGNTTLVTVDVTASETESLSSLQTNDLKYYTNSENDDKISKDLFVKLDKAINEETHEYEGLIHEVSAIDFTEYVDEGEEIKDIKLITAYNKYSYVIGIQVLATFNDGRTRLLTK